MIETRNGLTDMYKVYVYTTDGNCTLHRAYDYDFEDGWFKVYGLNESMYFKETIIDTIRIELTKEVNNND